MNSIELNREGRRTVESELLRRGATSITSSGTRRVWLHATHSGDRMIDILVKTKKKGNWHTTTEEAIQTTTPPESAMVTKFWVFVDFSGAPSFWIVPDWWIRNDIHKAHQRYLEEHGGHRARNDNSNHHSIQEERLEEWKDKWDILGIH